MKATSCGWILATLLTMSQPVMAQSVVAQIRAERVAQLGLAATNSTTDAWFASQMLVDPASPYSELIAHPAFTNELYWRAVLDNAHPPRDEGVTLRAMAAELGLTRARPGIDVTLREGFRDPFVAAHATKAGLDADIFWHVLDMFGYARAHHFAAHAWGLQYLRNQIRTIAPERQVAAGIYADVHERVMHAANTDALHSHDLRYLDTLVQHQMLHPGKAPGLPVAWRIARIAAAFRDARGYIGGGPCRRDGTPQSRYAGTGAADDERTPCLVAANDRAVHRWYVAELRRAPPSGETPRSGLAHLGVLVGALLPLLDMVALAEVVEAALADDLVVTGAVARADADAAAESAARVSCNIPE